MPLGLVQLVPSNRTEKINTAMPRLWLVFFSDTDGAWWWTRFFRPGFRHVCAASWFAGTERWVYFNPTRAGTVIDVLTDAEFGPRFQQLVNDSSAILSVRSAFARGSTPAACFCVGSIKALLGLRSRALSPLQLFRHLLATGAETISRPSEDALVIRQQHPTSSAGRPVDHGGARAPEAACRGGQNPRDAGSTQAGNAAA